MLLFSKLFIHISTSRLHVISAIHNLPSTIGFEIRPRALKHPRLWWYLFNLKKEVSKITKLLGFKRCVHIRIWPNVFEKYKLFCGLTAFFFLSETSIAPSHMIKFCILKNSDLHSALPKNFSRQKVVPTWLVYAHYCPINTPMSFEANFGETVRKKIMDFAKFSMLCFLEYGLRDRAI